MSDLKLFLETDVWELCPIKHDFKLTDLHDFLFLEKLKMSAASESTSSDVADSQDIQKVLGNYFAEDTEDPFAISVSDKGSKQEDILADLEHERTSEVFSDSDDDVAPELRADYIDEISGEVFMRSGSSGLVSLNGTAANGVPSRTSFASSGHRKSYRRQMSTSKVPLITNTTLSVLRYFGKYMQMMSLLKPVAFDVLICMSQLFDYYLYTVHDMFVFKDTSSKLYSNKLKTLLERIRANLILHSSPTAPNVATATAAVAPGVPSPNQAPDKDRFAPVVPAVDLLEDTDINLFSLTKRMVACESVVFLSQQFEVSTDFHHVDIVGA